MLKFHIWFSNFHILCLFWQLLGAANFFLLDGLQHHCERLCAGKVTFDNCINIYKQAKVGALLLFVLLLKLYIAVKTLLAKVQCNSFLYLSLSLFQVVQLALHPFSQKCVQMLLHYTH